MPKERKHLTNRTKDITMTDFLPSNTSSREVEVKILQQVGGEEDRCQKTGVNARASIGIVKPGHGLQVELYAKRQPENPPFSCDVIGSFHGTLDCHGGVFAAFPHAMGSLAQMMLPLACYVNVKTSTHEEWKAEMTLGAKRLSEATLLSTLEGIISNGDPIFVLELRNQYKTVVALLPTRASLLLASIKNSSSIPSDHRVYDVRYYGSLPNFSPKLFRSLFTWIHWWFWPLIFLGIQFFVLIQPNMILPFIPTLPFSSYIGVDNNIIQDVNDVLPPIPKSMVSAYQLGTIHGQINALMSGCDVIPTVVTATTDTTTAISDGILESTQNQINELLKQATQLVIGGKNGFSSSTSSANVELITVSQLNKILDELIKIENHISIISRVKGFFTFVNLMWFFAILGITISIGPSIYSVLKPLHEMLHRVCNWLYLNILLPIARKLHSWYVFEFMAWQLMISIFSTGIQLEVKEVGLMVCLTSTLLTIPCFTYTTLLKGKKIKQELLSTLTQLYFALICLPLAIHFNSTFYGYLTIMSLFGCLGFGVWAYPLCYVLGFSDKASMHRVCASSFFLLVCFIFIKVTHFFDVSYLNPFTSAISVFGTIMFLLSLLIMSSHGYNYGQSDQYWNFYNLYMFVSLLSLLGLGHTFGMIGMANTATVFTVLYGLEKYGDFHMKQKWNTWILVLMFSLVIWRLSLFLHSRPDFIATMFSGSIE